jgi:Fibronectin type III domain
MNKSRRRTTVASCLLALSVVVLLAFGVGNSAALGNGYTSVVFSDGFESGNLSNWNGLLGNGAATVSAASAHTGSNGLGIANATGQFQVLVKALPTPLIDTSVSFWARVAAGGGLETIAQTRDDSTSQHMWDLAYDGARQGLIFYPYSSTGSTEIFTGNNTAPAGTWFQVEVQYTATATGGGAQLYINGQTQAGWGVTGNYTRTANLQRLQLWNDGSAAVDFDDVSINVPPGAASVPGAPTSVTGTAGNAQVNLSWTAPASDGGSAITTYRITPYIGGTAQTPINTGSAATTRTVTGLTNGTAYTFTVAATNVAGTGPDSSPSAALTPSAGPTIPGAPTNVFGAPGNRSVGLSWTAPSDGGSAITNYRVTPYIGGTAQTSILTGSTATTYTVTGLTNGTAYTFAVAAINALGTGPNSATSAPVTPGVGYGEVAFADGFESGSLSAWNGTLSNGTAAVLAGAARSGNYGLRMTNTTGQFQVVVKALASPLVDSSTSFWVRPAAGSGVETMAQARDGSSSMHMWDLSYDATRHGVILHTYRSNGSDEIFSGNNTLPANTWTKVEVQYTATTGGGARLLLNGATQNNWRANGNYSRTANLQRLQLWNDGPNQLEFDDARVAGPTPTGATVAGAPTGVSGIARDRAVDLSWTAPTSNGGSAISGYVITPYVGGSARTPIVTDYPLTSLTVGGLTNGTAYTFTVAAVNGVGTGPASAASAAITPSAATLPGAPTGVVGTARDSAVGVAWNAPVSDGGSPITGYVITPYVGAVAQGPILTGSTQTSYTVQGLTNGTAYTFRVAAINAVGTGPASAPSAAVTPRAALSEYTNAVFTDGFESGGLSNWNGTQGTGTTSVLSAAAHTGGFGVRIATLETQYGFLVKALASPIQDGIVTFWIRPGTGAKVVTVAQARDNSSSVNEWQLAYDGIRHGFLFYPYSNTGSTEIFTGNDSAAAGTWVKVTVQYKATSTGGAQLYLNGQTQTAWGVSGNYARTADLQRLQLWNEGLTNNDFDDVSVATTPPVGATPPGAPTGVNGAPLDHAVAVSWTAPASDGGSPITGYRITPYIGATAQAPVLTGSNATNFTVAGLVNGTTYTFTVAAVNAAGNGPDSAASGPVTPQPAPPPGPPTGVTATAADASANLSWSAPASDGGSAIIGYRITPYIGGVAQTPINTGSTATTRTITGLTNGTTYTFTVAATNGSGTGAESAPSTPVTPTPATAPGAPTGVTGASRDSAVALTWTAPASDGGSAIIGYRITPYIGATAQTAVNTGSTATGYTVTGLTNGTAYTFTVQAINAIGTGPASAASAPVTPAVPPANPIVLENRQPGTTSWQFDIDRKATAHQIEGYASLTSVNKGGTISFMVNLSSNAQYNLDIYRMGYYSGAGGRLMQHVGPLNGGLQPACTTNTTQNNPLFGLTECNWAPSYTLSVPTSWTSGQYVVKLTRLDGQQLENYLTFTVRDDSSTAPVVYSMDVTTWNAYNFWGGSGNGNVGYDLYGRFNDLTGDVAGSGRAFTVSFDRPYGGGSDDGAGLFFNWDYPLVKFMESKGYDMTYVTSVDLEQRQNLLSGHRVFVNTGHDEYYSDGMRTTLLNGRSSGVNLALFSANNFYYRITWSANASGAANRRIFTDKNALPGSTTYEWRLLPGSLQHPENEIGGVMLLGVANDRPYLVSNASSWIYAGTGLNTYTGNGTTGVVTSGSSQNALPGLVGYEFDARASTTSGLSQYVGSEPAGTATVGHSFVPASDGNASNVWHDAVLYTASSGARVFSAGTIQWGWGVDNGYNNGYCSCSPGTYVNAATQRVTQNILDSFSAP